mmetsp:Transcript_19890/g.25618  ORF Transcript_19890/g.25618 Transcript_19890/m.25618 type:complete len:82 (-) Transcript_19890:688-933(-)
MGSLLKKMMDTDRGSDAMTAFVPSNSAMAYITVDVVSLKNQLLFIIIIVREYFQLRATKSIAGVSRICFNMTIRLLIIFTI